MEEIFGNTRPNTDSKSSKEDPVNNLNTLNYTVTNSKGEE
jgi:hypothetical protein